MERIKLPLAPGLEVQFADREQALKRMEKWADRGMSVVQVVHGPEGCGKTAWLRQSAVLLRELGFHVIYVDHLRKYFEAYTDVKDVAKRLAEAAAEALGKTGVKLASLVIDLADELIRRRKAAASAERVARSPASPGRRVGGQASRRAQRARKAARAKTLVDRLACLMC